MDKIMRQLTNQAKQLTNQAQQEKTRSYQKQWKQLIVPVAICSYNDEPSYLQRCPSIHEG